MTEKYIIFSLEDEKAKKLGEAISNSTCKKIISLLTEKNLTPSEIANELKIPINTVDYNLNKLIESGIIEKSKGHFWSKKGKKLFTYKVINKVILISPKKTSNVYSKVRGIVPVIFICAILTLLIAFTNFNQISSEKALLQVASTQESSVVESTNYQVNSWAWFALGSLVAILIILIINWKKL